MNHAAGDTRDSAPGQIREIHRIPVGDLKPVRIGEKVLRLFLEED